MKKNLDKVIKNLKKSNKNLGITLIALVVTIVILLIISTVAITLLVNNNLIGNAKYATDKYNNSVEKENLELGQFTNEIENVSSGTREATAMAVPTGCIISQMGTTAPTGYLACDGAIYDISAYPSLAEYINTQFGSYDYFKIGTETVPEGQFKVPDLRGEFLRGTGNNIRTTQGNGAAVGQHQDGTGVNKAWNHGSRILLTVTDTNASNHMPTDIDSEYVASGIDLSVNASASSAANRSARITTRPTNTAVLYCIKC